MSSRARVICLLVASVVFLPFCNGGRVAGPMDSQTHWLDECSLDSECGKLACLCGYCLEPCGGAGDCSSGRACTDDTRPAIAELCGAGPAESSVCLTECQSSGDCGSGERCVDQRCIPEEPAAARDGGVSATVDGGSSAGGTGSGGSAGTSGGSGGEGNRSSTADSGVLPTDIREWGRGTPESGMTQTDKVDLLLVVDNSISMADKQQILSESIPEFVSAIAASGVDLHVGVISSSLHLGSTLCSGDSREQENDRAHLVATRPRAAHLGIGSGVLEYAPGDDLAAFRGDLTELVRAVGEFGCGFESTLESWYRFLVDPAPHDRVEIQSCEDAEAAQCAVPTGVDTELLHQRDDFLRPDSALAIVVLSDENDCSIMPEGQRYYAARPDILLPRASSVCATNPNDPCCYSCDVGPGPECPNPPDDCEDPSLPEVQDPLNLRCFAQKRRFGIDFLYPVERYMAALTSARINDGEGNFVDNPIFTSDSGSVRDPSLVFLVGIVGVPWQDVVEDPEGGSLTYQTPSQLRERGTWDLILGDPEASPPVAPGDPLMIASVEPRGGTNPITGEPLEPPSASRLANSINGHEWANLDVNDLQYACIFPLAEPRDCASLDNAERGCDCKDMAPGQNNPLCQNPDGSYGTTQYFAKAYPATRHLQVLRGVGDRGIVTSICARNVDDRAVADFGYRPALRALRSRLQAALP